MISLKEAVLIEFIPLKISLFWIFVNILIEKFPKKFFISSNLIFYNESNCKFNSILSNSFNIISVISIEFEAII